MRVLFVFVRSFQAGTTIVVGGTREWRFKDCRRTERGLAAAQPNYSSEQKEYRRELTVCVESRHKRHVEIGEKKDSILSSTRSNFRFGGIL